MKYESNKDIQLIGDTINRVARQLDANLRWWTNYIFHHTSVTNAVNILKTGSLLSRSQIEKRFPEFYDSASPEVLQQTQDKWKDYVRFYFRPRTPTLYHSEGFRPRASQSLRAHCPMPIYLLFDLASVISLAKCEFAPGTLARTTSRTLRSAHEFAQLPFHDIYHDSWFEQENKSDIINARQAEVIFPQQMSLQYLRLICCRSQAEKDTLRNLVSSQLWNEWKDRIKVVGHQPVYFKKWLYVERATLADDEVRLEFNVPESPKDYGPFDITASVIDDVSGKHREVLLENTTISSGRLRYYGFRRYGIIGYQFRCSINGDLAYLGKHQERDIPF